jgi:phage shock protein A
MGIFGRMKTLLKANINDVTSKAEDPEKILNQLIVDMQEQLSQAKMQVRDTIADKKRLEKKRAEAVDKAADWEKKAMSAVKAGRDDLAREALTRKAEHDDMAAEYTSQLEAAAANVDELKKALRRLNEKIDEARRKKNTLVARAKRVEAQNSMATTANAATDTSAFDAFERNAAKIEDFETSVEAHAELDGSFQAEKLESKFRDLESDHGADDELARLKAKMGLDDG